ncbi:hypothetical protein [Roseospira navarrensis]|uniref:Uncharacterized protein n=1 Tax=Roseospira navarrensis TaxID=140058 RepID=A0A7X2D263_9PROT|nr:hypothetical protein [Roseospira navarrensis]MQX35423.1 hypothetical protein [Roseospira navarrensis]
MPTPSRDTLIAYAVAIAFVIPMILPVLDNIEEGQRLVREGLLTPRDRLRPTGLGPVSGLMVYVFSTPIAIALSRTLGMKLAMVVGLLMLALAVSFITGVLERGDVTLGLSLAWLALAAVVLIGAWAWQRQRRRMRAMRAHADALAGLVREELGAVRGSALGTLAREADGDSRIGDLVERMTLAAIWQASAEGPPETFRQRVLAGLAEAREDLVGNAAVDPHGQALAMMDRIIGRVRQRLRTLDLDRGPAETQGRR